MTDQFSPEVLVLDIEGNKVGQMSVAAAKSLAKDQGLDLVEIARQEDMSVARIMDRGKWIYEQKKNARKQSKHSVIQKEMRFRMRIDTHDLETKLNKVRGFLDKGSDVRLVIEMQGREKFHPEMADDFLCDVLSHFSHFKSEAVKKTKSNVSTILHPSKKG